MTKFICIILFLSFAPFICKCQTKKYFEGKILYKFEIKSKHEKVDSIKLKNVFGNGSILFFKEGNYYHKYDGGLVEFDFYRKIVNKVYSKMRGNDTLYWTDCGKSGEKIENFLFSKSKEKLLGINCDELIIQYKDKTETHYYNSDSLLTNSEWFKNFTLNDENIIDQKEKSIYLKNIMDYKYFLLTETAMKINKEYVDKKIFEIPLNLILSEQK